MSELPSLYALPRRDRRARWIVILAAAGVLLWMSLEDTNVLPVVLVALGLALLIAYMSVTGRCGGQAVSRSTLLIGAALIGAGIGAGTALTAALLMIWKTGMHAHPFPDYPAGLILDLLRRAPVWAVAGTFVGVAGALIVPEQKNLTTENTESTEN